MYGAQIIAICLSAHRSIAAQKLLTKLGFNAHQLKGGMKEWRKHGLPEVTEEQDKGEKEQETTESEKDASQTSREDEECCTGIEKLSEETEENKNE